jgi:hypothetical protein
MLPTPATRRPLACPGCAGDQQGQSTVEWVGLTLALVLALLAALSAATGRIPGGGLAGTIAERLICAVRLTEDCRREPERDQELGHVSPVEAIRSGQTP